MSNFGDDGPRGKRSKFGKFRGRKAVKPEQPLEYKNTEYLSKFIGPTGKLQSRRRTNFDGQDQRKLAAAVKMARFMGLLPYVGNVHGDQDRDSRGPRGPREFRGRRGDDDRHRGEVHEQNGSDENHADGKEE